MRIVKDYPPVYDVLCQHFPIADKKHILYCWGDIIFNPDGFDIPEHLIAHEEVHSKQQAEIGEGLWWDYFVTDVEKRLAYELPAHIVEVKVFSKTHKDRNEQLRYLWTAAKRLSSPMYGNCITFSEAVKRIKTA